MSIATREPGTETLRRFKRYSAYKDSGVQWLGEIPAHWHVTKMWDVTRATSGATPPKETLRFWDGGIPWVSPKDMKRRLLDSSEDTVSAAAISEAGLKLILNPAVLVVVRGMILAHSFPVGVTRVPVTINQDMKALRLRDDVDTEFFAYWLEGVSRDLLAVLVEEAAHGTKTIRMDRWRVTPVEIPPEREQRAIVTFLDRETARIDALLAKKERLIELLHEKRAALITQAVTKGLDPNVPMKDSGVEWLGDIPAHWTQGRLKGLVTGVEQGWSPLCENRQADDHEWGVLKVGCVNGEDFDDAEHKALPSDLDPAPEYEIRTGDILMSRANTRQLLGSAALVRSTRSRLLLCDKLYRIRARPGLVVPEFLIGLFASSASRFQFEREATGASGSMQNISQDVMLNLVCAIPPLAEQRQIVRVIERETARMSALILEVERAIATLRELRTALISAAVTGKIDVRGLT